MKDYKDMTDREKLIFVLGDAGLHVSFDDTSENDSISIYTMNDYEVEVYFNEDGSTDHVIAY